MFPFEPLEVYTLFDSILPMSTGIYAICNVLNGKYYIGSASTIGRYPSECGFRYRFSYHRDDLKGNKHHCRHLQNSYNYYVGELELDPNSVYEVWILEYVNTDLCIPVEDGYLSFLSPSYNSAKSASKPPMQGRNHTVETRQLMSEIKKGKSFHTEESRRKISEANKGKEIKTETRLKISQGNKGKPKSEEHCKNLSVAHKNQTNENLAKTYIGIDPFGNQHIFTNASAFARLNNLGQGHISRCANGERPSHKGWTFSHYDSIEAI
jgi:group I intron endonuclease